jgi:hypothetical protein
MEPSPDDCNDDDDCDDNGNDDDDCDDNGNDDDDCDDNGNDMKTVYISFLYDI